MYKVVFRYWNRFARKMMIEDVCECENEKEAQATCDELNKTVDPMTEIYEIVPLNN